MHNLYLPHLYCSQQWFLGLLTVDSKERLGAKAKGVAELKSSAFFADIDFAKVDEKAIPPPFMPNVSGELDTKYVPKGDWVYIIRFFFFMQVINFYLL